MTRYSQSNDSQAVLQATLATVEDVELAVLIGSRARGESTPDSDWDIALRLTATGSIMQCLDRMETIRKLCAESLGVPDAKIDLIDLRRARLAMRAVVAEEGVPLKGDDTLSWSHFLRRTWRELEDFYWEKSHAA